METNNEFEHDSFKIINWMLKHAGSIVSASAVIATLAFSYAYIIIQVSDIQGIKKSLDETKDAVIEIKVTQAHMLQVLDRIDKRVETHIVK